MRCTWADLSRLSQSVFRIFAELYQLLFHLSSLGVHAVRSAETQTKGVGSDRAWRAWGLTQQWASSAMAIGFVVPNLIMFGLLLTLLSLWPSDRTVVAVSMVVAGLLVAALTTAVALGRRQGRAALVVVLAIVAITLSGAGFVAAKMALPVAPFHKLLAIEALMAVAVGFLWIVRRYERHRPHVTRVAIAELAVVVLAMAARFMWTPQAASTARIVGSVLTGGEVAFTLLSLTWIWFTVNAVSAYWIGRHLVRVSKSLGHPQAPLIDRVNWTARLTLAIPAALFLVVTLSIWVGVWSSIAGNPVEGSPQLRATYEPKITASMGLELRDSWRQAAVEWFCARKAESQAGNLQAGATLARYLPIIEGALGPDHVPPACPFRAPAKPGAPKPEPTVYNVIWSCLYAAAGGGFGVFLIFLGLSAIIVVYALAPAALAERFPPKGDRSRVLGAWLDDGFVNLRWAGHLVITAVLVVMPLGIALTTAPRLIPGMAGFVPDVSTITDFNVRIFRVHRCDAGARCRLAGVRRAVEVRPPRLP